MKAYKTVGPDNPGFLEFYHKYNLAMSLDGAPELLQKHNLEGM